MVTTHRFWTLILVAASAMLPRWTLQPSERHPGYERNIPLPQPVIFAPGIISTGDYETHPTFTPGGDTLLYLKCAADFSTYTICIAYFRAGKWSEPEVAPFSGTYQDADPFITSDGKEVYFLSNRPVRSGDTAKADLDIWRIARTARGWDEPVHLEPPVNSSADEFYPTITDDGTLYFGSAREGGKGGCDIYCARWREGKYSAAVNLGDSINTADNEYEPFIAPDESYMIFMAARPGALRNADLYVSYRRNGVWSRSEKLPSPFNSPAIEFSPKVTHDGKYFFFSSTRNTRDPMVAQHETMGELTMRLRGPGNGLGDIYQVDFSALHLALPAGR